MEQDFRITVSLPGFPDVPGLTSTVIAKSTTCLSYLQLNTSEKSPCISLKFQRAYKFVPSQVSSLIAYLRMQDYPIGSNGKGYFWAKKPGELDQTIEHMESRIRRQSAILNKVKATREAMREAHQQQDMEL